MVETIGDRLGWIEEDEEEAMKLIGDLQLKMRKVINLENLEY